MEREPLDYQPIIDDLNRKEELMLEEAKKRYEIRLQKARAISNKMIREATINRFDRDHLHHVESIKRVTQAGRDKVINTYKGGRSS